MEITYTLAELPVVASKIISTIQNKTVLFYAEMGAGKTTLIKEIIKQLDVTDTVNSPTFSLVNEYLSKNNILIYHFDFYRIENEDEALDIGIDEYFNKNTWCFVEWPQNVENLLPLEAVSIRIDILDEETRILKIK